jgi:hypothetical protein
MIFSSNGRKAMSDTKRNIDKSKWDMSHLDRPVHNVQKLAVHKHGNGKRNKKGKYYVGVGGLNCPCCTKLPPEEQKVKERRLERRKQKVQDNLSKYDKED